MDNEKDNEMRYGLLPKSKGSLPPRREKINPLNLKEKYPQWGTIHGGGGLPSLVSDKTAVSRQVSKTVCDFVAVQGNLCDEDSQLKQSQPYSSILKAGSPFLKSMSSLRLSPLHSRAAATHQSKYKSMSGKNPGKTKPLLKYSVLNQGELKVFEANLRNECKKQPVDPKQVAVKVGSSTHEVQGKEIKLLSVFRSNVS